VWQQTTINKASICTISRVAEPVHFRTGSGSDLSAQTRPDPDPT
jgi:hypothetical protein